MKTYFLLSVYISKRFPSHPLYISIWHHIVILSKTRFAGRQCTPRTMPAVTRVCPGRGTWLRFSPNVTDSRGIVSQGAIVWSLGNASQKDPSLSFWRGDHGVCSFYQNLTAEHADKDSARSCRESGFHQSFCFIFSNALGLHSTLWKCSHICYHFTLKTIESWDNSSQHFWALTESRHLGWIISFSCCVWGGGRLLWLCFLGEWGNWGIEQFSNLSKVIQLASHYESWTHILLEAGQHPKNQLPKRQIFQVTVSLDWAFPPPQLLILPLVRPRALALALASEVLRWNLSWSLSSSAWAAIIKRHRLSETTDVYFS